MYHKVHFQRGTSMYSPPVIGLYGPSNSGKTIILTELIKQLDQKGYKVGTIKQTDKSQSMDTPEKDTWKYKEAGANIVVFSSAIETTCLLPAPLKIPLTIEKMNQLLDLDIIFIEGANDPSIPKIRIGTTELRENTLFIYDGDMNNLLNYVQNEIRKKQKKVSNMILKVNGKQIPLTEFPEEMIKKTITGMVSTLKGVEKVQSVELSFSVDE